MQPNGNRTDHFYASPGRLIPAAVLILIGTLFLLGNFHVLPSMNWFSFWPVILIALGLMKLVDAPRKGGYMGGAIMFGLGVAFLTDNLGFLPFPVWDLWPLILIAIGAGLLVERMPWADGIPRTRGSEGPRPGVSGAGRLNLSAVFSGGKRKFDGEDFRGGLVSAVFGGYEIDFRKATMSAESAVLQIDAVFGGCEVKIPENWNVVMHGAAVFGGFSDETFHPPAGAPGTRQFIVKGGAVFGGVVIKN